jgi:pyruvate dehydrogenase E2 component (dihydrolipoamide acetyltransferase)
VTADSVAAVSTASHTPSPPEVLVRELELLGVAPGTYDFAPLDGLRRLIAKRMVDSVRAAPHFALDMRIELDALLEARAVLNAGSAVRVSVNDFLIRAAALALMRHPTVNVTFTERGMITHRDADVAFAVAMKGGLVTPIIRRAQSKSVVEIASEAADLAARGRVKRLAPAEYYGGSFSVSNLGMFGVSRFDAIINQPQSAILSVGTAEKTQVPAGDGARWASVLTATLTSDHRAIDGATAASWLREFKALVEDPASLLEP